MVVMCVRCGVWKCDWFFSVMVLQLETANKKNGLKYDAVYDLGVDKYHEIPLFWGRGTTVPMMYVEAYDFLCGNTTSVVF